MRDGNLDPKIWIVSFGYVVSLPMRDGNPSYPRSITSLPSVVSLPMRDGNSQSTFRNERTLRLLAYL